MPGFNLSIGIYSFPSINIAFNDRLTGKISGDNFSINRYTLNKFKNDKIFLDNELYIIVLEGVVLNNHQLMKHGEKWEDTFVRLYETKGDVFFKNFRGSFSGLLYDKKKRKWLIFTDQIGSKHIYYTINNDNFLFTSEINDLYSCLKYNNLNFSLDEQSAYMLLSYGYMLVDNTLCTEIKKLLPGHYIKIEDNNFNIHQYFSLPDKYNESITEEETIENIDNLFRDAIRLQFEKDIEYGYKHLVALSGGLDSRMTAWVAHEMGYTNQLNFTFSQSDYLDETIAKEISADLKHEWIFKALDNGLFLRDIDEINEMTGGNVLYYGLAHANSMLKYINFEKLGILHTGQVGGIIKGYYSLLENLEYGGSYSSKLLEKVNVNICNTNLIKYERDFLFYNRQVNGTLSGNLTSNNFTETISPYLLPELIYFCTSSKIKKNQLMTKWILKKYPNAGNYVWENTKSKLGQKQINIIYKGNKIPINKIFPLVLQKAGLKARPSSTKKHMNPLEYWYNTNTDIKQFQDNYFNANIDKILSPDLKNDCMMLYNIGNAIEKNQVLTLLSAVKLFFSI